MFFIFGSPRSGTTLLAQCLDAHSDIVIPFETDFIVPMAFVFDRIRDPETGREIIAKLITQTEGFAASIGEFLDAAAVYQIVYESDYHPTAILTAIYQHVAAAAGKKMAGDKSPNDLLRLRILVKTGAVSQRTKIIHIVRDIRDVMASLKRTGWVTDLDAYFPRFWSSSNLYLHRLYRSSPQYLLIRYEDMVRAPEDEFARICAFLEIEFQPKMLLPSNRNPRYKKMGLHANLFKPITPDRIGAYKKQLDRRTLREYQIQAGEALRVFGYQRGLLARRARR